MRRILGSALGGLSLLVAVGCSDTAPPVNTGTMGGTAGAPVSTAGSGGSAIAGSAGTMSAMSGSASGGQSGGGMTAGGASGGGGSAGASGAGGSGGGAGHVPVPSKGCGKANPAEGGRTIQTGAQMANFNV